MFGFLNFGQPVTSPYLTVAGNQSMAVGEIMLMVMRRRMLASTMFLMMIFDDDDDYDDNDDWAGFVQAGLIGHRCASLLPY